MNVIFNITIALIILSNSIFAMADQRTGEQGQSPLDHTVFGAQNSLMMAPTYQEGEFSFPLLPSCPFGPAVPIPPLPDQRVSPQRKDQSPETTIVAEGIGRYKGMILIPAGPFEMGSPEETGRPDERPLHTVYLGDFYVSKYEVTNTEFCKFLNRKGEISSDGLPSLRIDDPSSPVTKLNGFFQPKPGFADRPVTHVSWYGASDYAQWAGGRLPTSAEWEKAAIYTSTKAPPDDISLPGQEQSTPVYVATTGAFGITGIEGNVWEWCSDWYSRDYYALSPSQNPLGPSLGQEKIIRGGSWAAPVSSTRIKNIHKAVPRGYYRTVGFRIVKD